MTRAPAQHPALQRRWILVVEDDYWVAQVLVDLLEEAGAKIVGPLGWAEEGLAFISNQPAGTFDSAAVDINLHGEKSYPIADALAARQIRFVFATGYGSAAIDAAYANYPRCAKPFNRRALIAALIGG